MRRPTDSPGHSLFNAVTGVSAGFTRELDIVGIGYKVDVKGKVAMFTLGYSHPIEFLLPDGVDIKIDKQTHIVLTGYDRQMLGQVAANMRALRPPDPYKNKGVRYTGEVLRKKVGKSGPVAREASKQAMPQINKKRDSPPDPLADSAKSQRLAGASSPGSVPLA